MPRYIFDIRDGGEPGEWVTELANLNDVRLEAVRFLGELLVKNPEAVWRQNELTLDVSDEHGLILFDVVISAVDSPAAPGRKRQKLSAG